MAVSVHRFDLPDGFELPGDLAIDTETLGLNLNRDRLCVVQLSNGDGNAHLVHFPEPEYAAPNLKRLLSNPEATRIFHYARFDLASIQRYLGVNAGPVFCTRIASVLTRTNADRHGLRDLCRDLLGVDISKQQQTSDWGAPELSSEQIAYAAGDVLYLHRLRERLQELLRRERREALAKACFAFLPARAALDIAGWAEMDIFAH